MPSAPPITISAFQGEQPRIIPRLMPETSAQSAIDARLDDGGLTPFRESVYIAGAGGTNRPTIYKYLDKWISFVNDTDVVPGPVAEDRIYYTDGSALPKMRSGDAIYDLAVPRPLVKPTTAITGVIAGAPVSTDVQTRQYIYTYVTDINGIQEESEPSPASNPFDCLAHQQVTLSGLTVPAAGRGVALQRFYRLQTGNQGTYFYFIAERGVSTSNHIDNVQIDAIAEPCPSIGFNAPPATLKGLTAMPNGMMAAFVGKKLYFCEPYKPHAWPEKYSLTTDYEIVALGAMGMTLLVTTVGQPYIVSGTHPSTMAMQKLEQNLPCIGKRSLVDLGYAIAYASNEGLVVARADGSVALATANIFSRNDWAALTPQTIIGCQYNGRYVAFYDTILQPSGTRDTAALFIDLSGQSFLIRSETEAQAAVFDVENSALYFVPLAAQQADQIRQFDAPGALPKFLYWKSKEFVLPYPENYGAFMIDGSLPTETTSPSILARQIAAIVEANNLMMRKRHTHIPPGHSKPDLVSIGGDINGMGEAPAGAPPTPIVHVALKYNNEEVGGQNVVPLDGDWLGRLPRGAVVVSGDGESTSLSGETSVTVKVYADKRLKASITQANVPVRLPSGFRARTWEIDVKTNGRVYKLTMAKTMDDLKRTP